MLLQLLTVEQDLPGIVGGLTEEQFNWAPGPNRWSIARAIEHVNLTLEKYLPELRKAIDAANAKGLRKPGPFALGMLERWFLGALEPPPRHRVRTKDAFVPANTLVLSQTVDRFARLHAEFAACIRQLDGIDLRAIKIKSQFGPFRWTLQATLLILLAHARRHLWQARQVRLDPAFPRASATR